MLTYHNKVARSKKFAKYLIIVNDILYPNKKIVVDSLDGNVSMNKMNKTINEFTKSTKSILCSARILNEGVNIPIVDSVLLMIDLVQLILFNVLVDH